MRSFSAVVITVIGSGLFIACGDNTAPPPKHAEAVSVRGPGGPGRGADATGTGHSTGMTYEDALAEPEDVMALKSERQLTNEELTAPMKNPSFLTRCSAPDSMSVTLKVAVRDGKALGVSVITQPDDATVAECIDTAVRELTWPASKHRDSFVTKF